MNSAHANYPPDVGNLVEQVRLHLQWIAAWPNAIERHEALQDVGVELSRHLESASAEAAVARAALGS
jgi:hypothetical protein